MTGGRATAAGSRIRYRFPPLERRGVIAGWRGGQVGVVAAGLVVAVLTVRSRPSVPGVVVAVVLVGSSVAVAFWPVAGRTGEQWLPVLARWAWAGCVWGTGSSPIPAPVGGSWSTCRGTGRRRLPSTTSAGRPRAPGVSVFDGLRIVSSADGDHRGRAQARGFGVVVDERSALSPPGCRCADTASPSSDPTSRTPGWPRGARVLASPVREGSAVHRLQWIESCVPDDGTAVRGHLADHAALGPDTPAGASYRSLLDESAPVTRRHRVLVAVTVHRGRSARAVRGAGGGLAGALVVLGREVTAVHRVPDRR